MSIDKYKWRLRILHILTPSYNNKEYQRAKKVFDKKEKSFHQRHIKLVSEQGANKFEIRLIGFNGQLIKRYTKLEPNKIFKKVDGLKIPKKAKPVNLSLYAEYKPKSRIEGLGFKNAEKAKYTIKKIKINTMIGRAKNHPHQTNDMKEAIKIFKAWKKKND